MQIWILWQKIKCKLHIYLAFNQKQIFQQINPPKTKPNPEKGSNGNKKAFFKSNKWNRLDQEVVSGTSGILGFLQTRNIFITNLNA